MAPTADPTIYAYVGTYTTMPKGSAGASQGIYVYQVDPASGAWTPVQTVTGIVNPTYLCLDPRQDHLYSVIEVDEVEGQSGGALAAYSIDRRTGRLLFINQQSTKGGGPCYLSVEQSGRYVLAANYTGGSLAMLPVEAGGRLGPASDFIQHRGSGPDGERQEQAHAHFITPDPSNRFALANDLGLDRVFVYRLDLSQGKLTPNDPPYGSTKPGAGPRHLAIHPNGRFVYVINELDETLTVFTWDGQRGALEPIQTVSTLPEDFKGTSSCADLHFSPNGRFLYGSNRGHDSLVIYSVDGQSGKVSTVGWEPTQGLTPRNFAIAPGGQYLFAANQDSDNIVAFRLDEQTGKLTPTGQQIAVPHPVCIQFLAVGG